MPTIVTVGAGGALGTVRKLAFGPAAVVALPDTNLAEKSYSVLALRPVNVGLVCHAPVPLRYWVAQPDGAAIVFNVTDVVVLLTKNGAAGGLGNGGTGEVLTADHALSVLTLNGAGPR